MQNVSIIGLGLIGGSIGLALRRWSGENGNALTVVGFDDDMEKQQRAKRMGAVDSTEWGLAAAVKDADIVIVATPVGTIEDVFVNIGEYLKPGAIVTDTGSTKADVMTWANKLPATVQFVGGHPMAGKAESLEAADADLFKGATWVVCPSVNASEASIRNVLGIIAATNAEAFFVDPVEHDSYVAGISHLPFLIAATLVDSVTSDPSWRDMRSLASSGFRDTTRLALGNPVMHRDILMTNREALVRWIDQVQQSLNSTRALLNDAEDSVAGTELLAFFSRAQDERARVDLSAIRSDEQKTDGVESGSVGDQMGRMLFGGFGRKKKSAPTNKS